MYAAKVCSQSAPRAPSTTLRSQLRVTVITNISANNPVGVATNCFLVAPTANMATCSERLQSIREDQ